MLQGFLIFCYQLGYSRVLKNTCPVNTISECCIQNKNIFGMQKKETVECFVNTQLENMACHIHILFVITNPL